MTASARQMRSLTLDQLLDGMVAPVAVPSIAPTGVTLDSRAAVAEGVFLACAGITGHGMDHSRQAAEKGVAAILAEPDQRWDERRLLEIGAQLGLPVIAVPHLSSRASEIAARFYDRPSDAVAVIGITGTNGKTSVSHFLAAALADGHVCGILGTLGYGLPGALQTASHTTPDAVRLQGELAALRAAGADCVAMEVSSHALAQHRVGGVRFHTAVFTNLSRDHLDYHGDMRSYGDTKAALFDRPGLQLLVINGDDAFGAELIARHAGQCRVIATGTTNTVQEGVENVTAVDIASLADGLAFTLCIGDDRVPVRSGLLGRFNVDNLLSVAGVLHGWGVDIAEIAARLERLTTVPGRMQRLGGAGKPVVVVDYAHTPDALAQVLTALRPHVVGRLHCVFGCGGDRDTGKRALMGEVAERLADRVTVTDDNPRSEDGDTIVSQVLAGMRCATAAAVIRDRAEAIAEAIAGADTQDLVLIAGKGHEDYQQVGDRRLPFSDIVQVRLALGEAV